MRHEKKGVLQGWDIMQQEAEIDFFYATMMIQHNWKWRAPKATETNASAQNHHPGSKKTFRPMLHTVFL